LFVIKSSQVTGHINLEQTVHLYDQVFRQYIISK